MRTWIVDGMNVVGSTPDGWWRDRRRAMRRLVGDLAAFAGETGEAVVVVFDGRPFDLGSGAVDVRFAARRGPDAADDEIARLVGAAPDPSAISVVTSDRELARRVGAHGARVVAARPFRRRLEDGP